MGGTDPDAGLRAVAALRALTERLEILQVDNARRAGWSWQQIAERLGVTKQTVHRKHGKRTGPSTASPAGSTRGPPPSMDGTAPPCPSVPAPGRLSSAPGVRRRPGTPPSHPVSRTSHWASSPSAKG